MRTSTEAATTTNPTYPITTIPTMDCVTITCRGAYIQPIVGCPYCGPDPEPKATLITARLRTTTAITTTDPCAGKVDVFTEVLCSEPMWVMG